MKHVITALTLLIGCNVAAADDRNPVESAVQLMCINAVGAEKDGCIQLGRTLVSEAYLVGFLSGACANKAIPKDKCDELLNTVRASEIKGIFEKLNK